MPMSTLILPRRIRVRKVKGRDSLKYAICFQNLTAVVIIFFFSITLGMQSYLIEIWMDMNRTQELQRRYSKTGALTRKIIRRQPEITS
jgi:hypothetical protein